ncbi:MAG: Gfo/Idh/MocA family oxidoreductase [Spirochaetes bacterium]|nr:Gfo/Idh/MocA family oxidoreductase [Spirochaetota bacterium]
MKNNNEFQSRFLSINPNFNYLPTEDRYLQKLPQPKYRANLIGAGMIGQEHLRITILEGRAMINGLYDPNPGSIATAKQEFAKFLPGKEPKVFQSLKEACQDPDADILLICTPNFTHLDVLKEAVKSGKHIFLEKPMATTLQDAFEIVQIAKNYDALLQIGLQYRYKAIYHEAIHETLERQSVGDIKTISLLEHRIPFLDKVNQWNKFSKYSGGSLVEKCCHYFDLINHIAKSKPQKVYATGSQAINFKKFQYQNEKSDIIDNAFVCIDYENEIRGSFNLSMFSPMFFEQLIVCGNQGHLIASEKEDFMPGNRMKSNIEIMRGEDKPGRRITPHYPDLVEMTGHNGATFIEHIKLIDNIEGQKTSTATPTEGFWSVVVGIAAEESVQSGKPVYIEDLLKDNKISLSDL